MAEVYIVLKGIERTNVIDNTNEHEEDIEKVFCSKDKAIDYVSKRSREEVDALKYSNADYFVRLNCTCPDNDWLFTYAVSPYNAGTKEERYFRIHSEELE